MPGEAERDKTLARLLDEFAQALIDAHHQQTDRTWAARRELVRYVMAGRSTAPFAGLVADLCDFWTPEEVSRWLRSEHELLGWQTPLEVIEAGRIDKVIAVVCQILEGSYT